MAKKKTDKISKPKLDLGQTLYALDTRNLEYYNNLSDDDKKSYAPLILMRFMSSAPNQGSSHEYHILSVNELVNQDFWNFSKNHKELQHLLLSLCGIGNKQYHSWIAMPKKLNSEKLQKFIQMIHPGVNSLECELFIKNNTVEDLENLGKDYALDDKEIEELVKQFENVKTDASNE